MGEPFFWEKGGVSPQTPFRKETVFARPAPRRAGRAGRVGDGGTGKDGENERETFLQFFLDKMQMGLLL